MNRLSLPLALAAASVFTPLGASAQEAGPGAEEILRMARGVFADERYFFEGELRPDNRREEIELTMEIEGRDMAIHIEQEPRTTLFVSLAGGGEELLWQQPARGIERSPMPAEGLEASIRGTDLAYEDIGMRFLYWEDSAERVADETVSARECWTVLARNPGNDGPYGFVYVRVDQSTGALMQVLGYDRQGQLLKRFKVDDVQLHGGQYYLRRMRIESINHQGTRDTSDDQVEGRTYLVLDSPQRAGNGF